MMPVLFVGHGSPMNAIEDNNFSRKWKELGRSLPKPTAILMVSAHWYNKETSVNDSDMPAMIYDMYGFPDLLYEVKHPVMGSPLFAHETVKLISRKVNIDNEWGYDHGAWSVLVHMYPSADVPVFQLSIDKNLSLADYFEIGKEISALREQGVLIIGSGNIVHNLGLANFYQTGGFPWAYEFDRYIKENILNRNFDNVINYEKAGDSSKYAFFTKEHFAPLIFILGATKETDTISVFNEECVMGSISMTGYLFK